MEPVAAPATGRRAATRSPSSDAGRGVISKSVSAVHSLAPDFRFCPEPILIRRAERTSTLLPQTVGQVLDLLMKSGRCHRFFTGIVSSKQPERRISAFIHAPRMQT